MPIARLPRLGSGVRIASPAPFFQDFHNMPAFGPTLWVAALLFLALSLGDTVDRSHPFRFSLKLLAIPPLTSPQTVPRIESKVVLRFAMPVLGLCGREAAIVQNDFACVDMTHMIKRSPSRHGWSPRGAVASPRSFRGALRLPCSFSPVQWRGPRQWMRCFASIAFMATHRKNLFQTVLPVW